MRAVWVLAVACACTSQPAPDPLPPAVATFHVTVDGDGSVDPKDVQLAIVWWKDFKTSWPERALEPQSLLITQHSLTWPMTIDAILTERPSYNAYWSADTVGVRPGRLVAYVDSNHNGTLDFTDVSSSAFTDRILAYAIWNEVHYYTTVDVFSQQIDGWNDHREVGIDTPVELYDRSSPRESCHLLRDWRTGDEYGAWLSGSYDDPNDPHHGPWDRDASGEQECPGDMAPAGAAISCDYIAPQYAFQAEELAQASPFIAQTCGMVMRVCQVHRGDPTAPGPWPCPCDPSMYSCLPDGSL